MAIFGFDFFKKEEKLPPSPITPVDDEGSVATNASGFYGVYVDIAGSAKNEGELIQRYRDIAQYPDVDNAVEEITTEVIAAVDSEPPVKIDTSEIEYSDKIKKTIEEEFENILRLLDFKDKGHDIFKRWHIKGRVYKQKNILSKSNIPKKEKRRD